MKNVLMMIGLAMSVAGATAQAGEMCESRAAVLKSYLEHPLLQMEIMKPQWKYYSPLLKGVTFKQEQNQKITVQFKGQSLTGNKVCIDFASHKIHVIDDLGGTDAASLIPKAAPSDARAPASATGSLAAQ